MEEQLQKLFQELFEHVDGMVPGPWEKIALYAEATEYYSSNGFYFTTEEGSFHYCTSIPEKYNIPEDVFWEVYDELDAICREMRKCFIDNNQQPWEGMGILYFPNGKGGTSMKSSFTYDVDQNIDSIYRERTWAREQLNVDIIVDPYADDQV